MPACALRAPHRTVAAMSTPTSISVHVWWTSNEVAEYLRVTPRTFVRRIANSSGFPLRRTFSARRDCWSADEVKAWAERQVGRAQLIREVAPGAIGPAHPHGPMRSRQLGGAR